MTYEFTDQDDNFDPGYHEKVVYVKQDKMSNATLLGTNDQVNKLRFSGDNLMSPMFQCERVDTFNDSPENCAAEDFLMKDYMCPKLEMERRWLETLSKKLIPQIDLEDQYEMMCGQKTTVQFWPEFS